MNSTGGLYRILEWVTRFVYVNLLWIVFSLLGLLLIGFAPATAALFSIMRKWLTGQTDIAVFSYFFKIFKESLIQANILFYLAAGFGYSLYFYRKLIESFDGLLYAGFFTIWLSVIIFFSIVLLYLFPVYVHFDVKVFQYFKYALLIGITSPKQTLLIMVNFAAVTFIFYAFPSLIPFFFGSTLSFTLMWIALSAFKRLEKKTAIYN